MAHRWFVRQADKQNGPLSADQLKQLAASGEIAPTDLVQRDGMTEWTQAGSVRGLFPDQKPTAPPPLPATAVTEPVTATTTPEATVTIPSPQSIGEKLRAGWTSFLGTAKAAKDLTAAQARRAKLSKFDLPAAYLALGKSVFGSGSFKGEFTDLFDRIEKTKAEIQKLGEPGNHTPGTGFKEKVRAGAATLKAKGRQKALSVKLDALYRELGQQAFDTHGESAGPEEVVAAVVRCRDDAESLDRKIARLSEVGKGKLLTPKRLIVAGGVVGVLLLLVVFTSIGSGSGKGASGEAAALLDSEQRQQIEMVDVEPGSRADAIQALVILSVRPAKVGGVQTVQATAPASLKDKVTQLVASFEDADKRSRAIQDRAVYNADQKSFLIAVPFHTNISMEDCKTVFGGRATIDARTQWISGMSKPSTFVAVTIQCSDGTLTLTGNDLRQYDVLSIMQFYPGRY